MMSSSAVTIVNRASFSKVQSSAVAPFVGLKSMAGFPVSKKVNKDITSITSNGGRVHCMQVRKQWWKNLMTFP
jgi:ribulose-bisphosphate carboxylase small chain